MKLSKYLLILLPFISMNCDNNNNNKVKVNKGWSIDTVCIEHHTYYETRGLYGGGIAPKLTDDGKPCHCDQ